MLRQLGRGRVFIEVVGRKALMMARNVSPEVSPRPRKEKIDGEIFYIRCCNTDSYRKRMEAGFRLEVQSVKSTAVGYERRTGSSCLGHYAADLLRRDYPAWQTNCARARGPSPTSVLQAIPTAGVCCEVVAACWDCRRRGVRIVRNTAIDVNSCLAFPGICNPVWPHGLRRVMRRQTGESSSPNRCSLAAL